MKLVLVRHAKSDWGSASVSDHDRPLNDRGRRDAPRMGAWLRDQGHSPTQAFVSTANRAAQTWAGLAAGLGSDISADYSKALYHAEPQTLLSHIHAATEATLLIVAHNPGIAACAYDLVDTKPNHARFLDYPTCATLVASFDTDRWGDVTWGSGNVLDFATPHDLSA